MLRVKPQYAGKHQLINGHTSILIDNTLTQEVLRQIAEDPNTAEFIEDVAETKQRNVIKKDTSGTQED